MQWDDLRIFLHIARAGTLAGAARTLGVNHSTVFRRLNAFEERLGVRLFERLPDGYVLTIAGEEMRASAEEIEHEITRLDRKLTGQDLRLSGPLAVTTTDTIANYLLAPHLGAFKRAYPGIALDLLVDSQNVNLSKRDADVAIRPTLSPPDALVGRRLCTVAFAPYVRAKPVAEHEASASLPWVMVDDSLSHLASAKWLKRTHPDAAMSLRTNSLHGVMAGVEGGLGIGLLPCFMGDKNPILARHGDVIEGGGADLWLLTHEDLRQTTRVRAFMEFIADALLSDVDLLEGRAV